MSDLTADFIRGVAADAREKQIEKTNLEAFWQDILGSARRGELYSSFPHAIYDWEKIKFERLGYKVAYVNRETIIYWGTGE